MKARMAVVLVMLMLLVGISAPADADVLCTNPSGSVFVRTQCKGNETPLNPVALGFVGPAGPQGPAGPEGPAGLTQLTIRQNFASPTYINPGTNGASSISCSPGERATGGGYFVNAASFPFVPTVTASYPESVYGPEPDTWSVGAYNSGSVTISLAAYVICAAP